MTDETLRVDGDLVDASRESPRDLVEHLRTSARIAIGTFYSIGSERLMLRAADEIERLRDLVERDICPDCHRNRRPAVKSTEW